MNKNANIGNPLILAAAQVLQQKGSDGKPQYTKIVEKAKSDTATITGTVKKITKIGAIATGVVVGSYITYKGYKILRRNALLKKAYSDPEVTAAVDIWNCVPDGIKKKWSITTFLNPINLASETIAEIKTLWQDVNTQRLMAIAKRIYENQLKINQVQKNFKALYNIDLMTLINNALKPAQVDVFNNMILKGSGSTKPAVVNGQLALTKQEVFLRKAPKIPSTFSLNNVVKTAPPRMIAGQVTGREETFTDGKDSTVFVEIMAYDSSVNGNKYSVPVWAWKGALEFYPAEEIKRIYGNLKAIDVKQTWTDSITDSFDVRHWF